MRSRLLAAFLVAAVALAACGDDGDDETSTPSPEGGTAGTIHTVAPLEGVATRLLEAYRSNNPDSDLALTVSPQAQAVQAVADGAGSLAILPRAWLARAGPDVESTMLGRSLGIIVVPAGNPGQVTGVSAFAPGTGLETAMCGPDTPFGNFAALIVRLGGVEPDAARVRSGCAGDAVNQVASGQLDAALVFRNNVTIPEGVEVISIPDDQNLIIEVAYTQLADNEATRAFVDFLGSNRAQQLLTRQGLLP